MTEQELARVKYLESKRVLSDAELAELRGYYKLAYLLRQMSAMSAVLERF